MAASKSLSKMRIASRLCKLGAWVIAAMGLVAAGLYVSTLIQLLSGLRQDQASPYAYLSYGSVVSALFLITVPTLFFAIILYAMGTLMDFMSAEAKREPKLLESEMEEERDDEGIEIVPLPDMR